MVNPTVAFNELVEQYAFRVAERFIEFAGVDQQAQLIQFIHGLNCSDPSVEAGSDQIEPQLPITAWEQELSKPVNLASVHLQWRISMARHRVQRNEAHITHLEAALQATQHRYDQSLSLFYQESHQITWRHLVSQYERYLAQARAHQKVNIARLNTLSH